MSLALLMFIEHLSLVSIITKFAPSVICLNRERSGFCSLRQTKQSATNFYFTTTFNFLVTVCNFDTKFTEKNACETMINFLNNIMVWLIRDANVTIICLRKRYLTFECRGSS